MLTGFFFSFLYLLRSVHILLCTCTVKLLRAKFHKGLITVFKVGSLYSKSCSILELPLVALLASLLTSVNNADQAYGKMKLKDLDTM